MVYNCVGPRLQATFKLLNHRDAKRCRLTFAIPSMQAESCTSAMHLYMHAPQMRLKYLKYQDVHIPIDLGKIQDLWF